MDQTTSLKQRPGDQPLPVKNDRVSIQQLVIDDIEARRALGRARYGTELQAFNGRNALQDAYEEALDLAIYLRQCIEEAKGDPLVSSSTEQTTKTHG